MNLQCNPCSLLATCLAHGPMHKSPDIYIQRSICPRCQQVEYGILWDWPGGGCGSLIDFKVPQCLLGHEFDDADQRFLCEACTKETGGDHGHRAV